MLVDIDFDFYLLFFTLSEEDRDALEEWTTGNEPAFSIMIRATARWYRQHLRENHPDPLECRQILLVKTLAMATEAGLGENSYSLPSALALCVTDQVEQLVRKMDFEEEQDDQQE